MRITHYQQLQLVKEFILLLIIICLIAVFFFQSLSLRLDDNADNYNVMLCKSALKSGNLEYLDKCDTYYNTGDIRYMKGL